MISAFILASTFCMVTLTISIAASNRTLRKTNTRLQTDLDAAKHQAKHWRKRCAALLTNATGGTK